MKNLNVYLLIALAIISCIVSSLAYSADVVPAVFAVLLLVSILVLGMAAGQHDSRAEIEHLQRSQEARCEHAQAMQEVQTRLERELNQLRAVRAVVGDIGGSHAA